MEPQGACRITADSAEDPECEKQSCEKMSAKMSAKCIAKCGHVEQTCEKTSALCFSKCNADPECTGVEVKEKGGCDPSGSDGPV